MGDDEMIIDDGSVVEPLDKELEKQILNAVDPRFLLQLTNILLGGSSVVGDSSNDKIKDTEAATYKCPKQPGFLECGYCVMKYMKEMAYRGPAVLVDEAFWKQKDEYTEADFDDVREDWADFVTSFIYKEDKKKKKK